MGSAIASADEFTLDLSSTELYDASQSTGFWNSGSSRIQAPLSPGGVAGAEINFGDGSDGVFNDGPLQTGISNGGANTFYIDTDVKSVYQFTSFTTSAPVYLILQGAQPLVIRSLGNISIAGNVLGNGFAGAANTSSAGNVGGSGSVGASSGGKGGTGVGGVAVVGNPTSGNFRGGGIGANTAAAGSAQGGGGGCTGLGVDANDATSGTNGGANRGACATTRNAIADLFESVFQGGAGGGGGGGYTGAPSFNGSGGGGGGGAIHVTALGSVSITGTIQLTGGNGGALSSGNGVECGGGGGGGSGGSFWVQTASTVSGAGAIFINHGFGGSGDGTACASGAFAGGDGSRGIYRVDNPSGAQTISVTPAGSAYLKTASIASGQTYEVVSKSLPIGSYIYDLQTPVVTQGCGAQGTLSVTYEGSWNGVSYGSAVTGAQIAQLNDFPYLRFKASITTSGANPPCLTGLKIPYVLRDFSDYKIKGGLFCGTTRIKPGSTSSAGEALGDFVILLISAAWIPFSSRIRSRKKISLS